MTLGAIILALAAFALLAYAVHRAAQVDAAEEAAELDEQRAAEQLYPHRGRRE